MIRLSSQVPRPYWLAVYMLICCCFFFPGNLEGMYPWLVWCSLFWQDIKLCWKPCFSRAVPQSYLRGCLLVGSNTTLLYSYYSLVIDYLCWQFFLSNCAAFFEPAERSIWLSSVNKLNNIFNMHSLFFLTLLLFIYLLAVLGLCFCARAFSSCGKREPLFIAVCGALTIAASLVAEHRLQSRRLSSCGSRA